MEVIRKPFNIQEISFANPGMDKVHVECLCRILRADTTNIQLASHSTEYGKLMMRILLDEPSADARTVVRQAARQRRHELEHMLLSLSAS